MRLDIFTFSIDRHAVCELSISDRVGHEDDDSLNATRVFAMIAQKAASRETASALGTTTTQLAGNSYYAGVSRSRSHRNESNGNAN